MTLCNTYLTNIKKKRSPATFSLLKGNWNPSGGELQSSLAHDGLRRDQSGQRIHIFQHFLRRLHPKKPNCASVLWLGLGHFQVLIPRPTRKTFRSTSKSLHIWYEVGDRGQVDTRGLHFRLERGRGGGGGVRGNSHCQCRSLRRTSGRLITITALSFPE